MPDLLDLDEELIADFWNTVRQLNTEDVSAAELRYWTGRGVQIGRT